MSQINTGVNPTAARSVTTADVNAPGGSAVSWAAILAEARLRSEGEGA